MTAGFTDAEGALTDAGRDHLARALEGARRALVDLIDDTGGRAGTVSLDPQREGRVSRADALQQQQMAKAGRRRAAARLERVEAALERLEADPDLFGWCPDCETPIPWRRLEAMPETVLCVPCLQKRRG